LFLLKALTPRACSRCYSRALLSRRLQSQPREHVRRFFSSFSNAARSVQLLKTSKPCLLISKERYQIAELAEHFRFIPSVVRTKPAKSVGESKVLVGCGFALGFCFALGFGLGCRLQETKAAPFKNFISFVFVTVNCLSMEGVLIRRCVKKVFITGVTTFLTAVICLQFVGCSKPAAKIQPLSPAVSVAKPVDREVVEWDEYIGRLESPHTVEVRARVSGYLDAVHFKEGKLVNKGDLLMTIDQRPYKAEYDRAQAEYERSVSQAELAKNDAERAGRLIKTRAISDEEFDTRTKLYSSAQSTVKSARAAADLARLNLEFTEIRAPINGRIGRALVTEGNLVTSGISGTGATLLTTIVSLDPIYCYSDADERAVLKYRRLSAEGRRVSARDAEIPAEMALADELGFPHKGRIDFVDNQIDPGTGTVRARGVFRNPDQTLTPGYFARLRVPGSGKYQALLIPDRAIGSDQGTKFVYVVNSERKVEYRSVISGPVIDGLRVIKEGLKPGENVIVEGLLRVRPGIAVEVKPGDLK
jgi:membrane fusion protein, multidrug efflux system